MPSRYVETTAKEAIVLRRSLGIGEKPRIDLYDFVGTANSLKWKSYPPGTMRCFGINVVWNHRTNAFEIFGMFIPFDGYPVRKYVDFNVVDWGHFCPQAAELN